MIQRIPTSTYRLQFNRSFTFAQAREIVPYLHSLGIGALYASPYFQARAESTHGYDITDHNKLNTAIGTRGDYDALVAELHAHEMGQVLDFVPNHMGIGEPLNHWWMDVLENGPSSVYAPYFDIDWQPLKPDLRDKVLLPVLGDQYGRVLERGELKVTYETGAFFLNYYDHQWPIAPGTYRHILQVALQLLEPYKEEIFYADFASIITSLDNLPRRNQTEVGQVELRAREKEVIKRRLDRRCQEEVPVHQAIEDALKKINGTPGDARSFDALDAMLNEQAYRLSFWRVAAEEINYRRFFDVNDLAAIRMELPEVFENAHRLLLELVKEKAVTGLRIDHPDGLYLPKEYFEKLQARCSQALGASVPQDGRAIYLVVEKILSGHERLPEDWPVHGTTGYDFARSVNNLLCDASAEQAITKTFRRFVGHSQHFGHLVYAKKRLVMRIALSNDVKVLGNMLDRLSEKNRWYRDFTLDALNLAVRETIACFPVYRTYLTAEGKVSEEDRAVIERAVNSAKRRNPAMEESVFNFLRDVLLFRFPENLSAEERAEHVNFVLKFQQCTGPIMAKGLEDTAFYIFNRLAALNEVGGEPQQFGISPEAFHAEQKFNQEHWPATMLTTSTHDTKRSEDVRARMVAISEMPEVWRSAILRWRAANRKAKTKVEETEAPDFNEEYLLYQTLLGTWPFDATEASDEYIERIQAYMTKALKEAKVNTSWIQPNEPWDEAVKGFVGKILQRDAKNKFLPLFLPVAEKVAQLGAINSLTQTLLKLTVPGMPDIYQGNELWDFSLVDPDNRRPVDYQRRREMLDSLGATSTSEMLASWKDGRIKLFLTQKLLQLRCSEPDFFLNASYQPLVALGAHAESVIAFTREFQGQSLLVIAPRLSSRVGFPPVGELWRDTTIELPMQLTTQKARDVFTGREIAFDGDAAKLADLLQDLPFAAIVVATGDAANADTRG